MHRHTLSSLLTDPTSSHSHGTTDAYGQPTPSTSNSSPGLHQLDANGNGEDGGAPGRKGKGSKKRDKVDGSDGEFDEGALAVGGPEKKIRKRNRLALSCTSCKSRKIKCSRTTPCEACCRRGEEAGCHWETARIDVTPQPFALATEHEKLKQRVTELENFLRGHQQLIRPPEGMGPIPHAYTNGHANGQGPSMDNQHYYQIPPAGGEEDLPDSDTEDAALVLEELALGRKLTRVGSRARKSTNPTPPMVATPPIVHARIPVDRPLHPVSRAMASLLIPPVDARRKLVLDDIWACLPTNKPVLDWLVANYFSRADWGWHLHHKPSFMAEYEAFSQLVAQGRKDEIDPLWIAIFCMTLCLSVKSLESSVDSPLVSITEHDLLTLPNKFFDAAQGCLESGDWTGKPRIRTLQTIVLFAPFLLFAGTPATGEKHQTYLAAGVRIAQQMGLHKLGSDPSTMPPEDPALPPGVNTLRREIPIRLFYVLLFLEYMNIRVRSGLSPALVNCALPGNFNDVDLSPDGIVAPRPDDELTDISFEICKYKVALQQRIFNEVAASDTGFEYETILDLDKGYRDIIDTLPRELGTQFQPPMTEELTATWRRNMVTQTINNRLLRLHRPFMSRGYRESKYRYSTKCAIFAARTCLITQQSLDRAPLLKLGFQLLNVQGAVVVLFFELWTEWPEDLAINSDFRLIRDVVPFFERNLASRQLAVRTIAQQSLQVIGLLLDAVEKRRVESEARKAGGGSWGSEIEEETYGRLLKRIGTIVVTTATSGLDSLGAASRLVSDQGAPNGHSTTAATDMRGMADSSIDPALAPTWTGFSYVVPPAQHQQHLPVDAVAFTSDDYTSLAGPAYADPNFDWMGWTAVDQFATLGSF